MDKLMAKYPLFDWAQQVYGNVCLLQLKKEFIPDYPMININGQRDAKSGLYGRYFKINETKGVKVLMPYYDSVSLAKKYLLESAEEEHERLIAAEPSGVSPKDAKIVIVRIKMNENVTKYSIGIEMEHVGDKTLYDTNIGQCSEKFTEIENFLHEKLKKCGVYCRDWHEGNIVMNGDKYYRIDFSPLYVEIDKNKAA